MQWGQLWLGQQGRHTDAFELVHWTQLLGHMTTWEESIFYPDLHPFQHFLGVHLLSKHSVMTKNAVPQKKKECAMSNNSEVNEDSSYDDRVSVIFPGCTGLACRNHYTILQFTEEDIILKWIEFTAYTGVHTYPHLNLPVWKISQAWFISLSPKMIHP